MKYLVKKQSDGAVYISREDSEGYYALIASIVEQTGNTFADGNLHNVDDFNAIQHAFTIADSLAVGEVRHVEINGPSEPTFVQND